MNRSFFLYGPLADAKVLSAIVEPSLDHLSAQLQDMEICHNGRAVSFRPAAGSCVAGFFWIDIPEIAQKNLALFAMAYQLTPVEVEVVSEGQRTTAITFRATNEEDNVAGSVSEDGLEIMRFAAAELFDGRPLPAMLDVQNNWPMVEKRAWAKVLASRTSRPAVLRRQPGAGDVKVHQREPRVGSFYRMQNTQLSHKRFDGKTEGPMQREAFLGIDAALVLPYDRKTDRVLFIEQMRMGPLMRGESNPWSLEPIAGMIDAGETPERAARREAKEEADLEFSELRFINGSYPSPGSATDYFYSYLGLCELSKVGSYFGGLESENEDLRAHVIPFDAAMSLVKSGEIATGPLMAMLYWLALERGELRGLS